MVSSQQRFACINIIACLLLLLNIENKAQLLTYSNDPNGLLSSTAINVNGSSLMRVNTATVGINPCTNGFTSAGFSALTAYNTSLDAIETSLRAAGGYMLNVTGFSVQLGRNIDGPSKVRLTYSTDGVNWIAQSINQAVPNVVCDSGVLLNWNIPFTVIAPYTLKFRIYGFKATDNTGKLQVLNLNIDGTVSRVNCVSPVNLSTDSITKSSAKLKWTAVADAANYKVYYRVTGTLSWTSVYTSSNSITISGLAAATNYQFYVRTFCSETISSVPSLLSDFTTLNVAALPKPNHIVILMLENEMYASIIGSPLAPFINALANDSNAALFTQSYGVEHPSQPNYLDLFSGSNQGVTNDKFPLNNPFTTPNLARSLLNDSLTFITYSEDLPSVGFNGKSSGLYVRKHNPVANWMGTGINQVPVTTNQPFSAFPTVDFDSLPTVCYVVPNQENNMHNGIDTVKIPLGDNWTYTNLNSYIQWAKTHNSLFILTFDEDNGTANNHMATIFLGPMVQAGQYSNHIDHFNVLRTLEDMYSLPYAGNASSPIDYCWKPITPRLIQTNNNLDDIQITVYPNPVSNELTITNDSYVNEKEITILITDIVGNEIYSKHYSMVDSAIKIETTNFAPGIYFIKIKTGEKQTVTKFIKQ